MKIYRVVIMPTDAALAYTSPVTVDLLRMTMEFAVHDKAPLQDPEQIVKGTLKDMYLLGIMEIKSITEVKGE